MTTKCIGNTSVGLRDSLDTTRRNGREPVTMAEALHFSRLKRLPYVMNDYCDDIEEEVFSTYMSYVFIPSSDGMKDIR